HKFNNTKEAGIKVVICLIIATIMIHSHLIPTTYLSISNVRRQTSFMESSRQHRQLTRTHPDVSNSLGLIFPSDLFTFCVLMFSMMTAVACFLINIILRNRTIKKFREFEVQIY
ncbi:hypothetical protein PENTCL1PPCAC_14032, partial [Pristionchus entomophagus]